MKKELRAKLKNILCTLLAGVIVGCWMIVAALFGCFILSIIFRLIIGG